MRSLTHVIMASFVVLAVTVPTMAQTNFQATLDGAQEVDPTPSTATGTATLTLNAAQDRLTFNIFILGLDLDGLQTPADPNDNVTGLHIHAAPAGVNGGVVFGMIAPNNDQNAELVINPVAGTVVGGWDLNEGNNTTLADQLTALFDEGLYFNVHTPAFPGGEIRGQIIPEPVSLTLLGLGGLGLAIRRRP